jgi:hypothetical protein
MPRLIPNSIPWCGWRPASSARRWTITISPKVHRGSDPHLVPKGGYIPSFAWAEPASVAVPIAQARPELDPRRLLVATSASAMDGEDSRPISIGLFEQLTVELTRYADVSVVSIRCAEHRRGGQPAPTHWAPNIAHASLSPAARAKVAPRCG